MITEGSILVDAVRVTDEELDGIIGTSQFSWLTSTESHSNITGMRDEIFHEADIRPEEIMDAFCPEL